MKYYYRIYKEILKTGFLKAINFKVHSFSLIFSDVLFYAAVYGLWLSVLSHTDLIAGLTPNQMLFFISTNLLVDCIQMVFITDAISSTVEKIKSGKFDFIILKPCNTLFLSLLSQFNAASVVNLVFTFSSFVYFWHRAGVGLVEGIGFILLLLFGFLIYISLRILVASITFWTISSQYVWAAFWELIPLAEMPHRSLNKAARFILLSFLPFGLIYSFPIYCLFEGFPLLMVSYLVLFSLGFSALTIWIWNLSIQRYCTASS
ncbi:MAG: ABC-2 family transporter protein [bacterium]|nr:ABC-2 family transporter protein [bacterium]